MAYHIDDVIFAILLIWNLLQAHGGGYQPNIFYHSLTINHLDGMSLGEITTTGIGYMACRTSGFTVTARRGVISGASLRGASATKQSTVDVSGLLRCARNDVPDEP
ncbi:MAG: hypothetical protein IKM74_07185 [Bacteroidales bacterium]|nr:hypothetical protein [Bacteroidales bacterium]